MKMTESELATQKMLTKMAEDIAAIKNTVADDHKSLFGNGQPGLIERMAKLETRVYIFGCVVSTVCVMAAEAVKHFFF